MTTQGSVIVALLALVLLGFILNMLRKRRLSEEVSLIWIFAFAAVIVLMALPTLTSKVTHLVGAIYPASVLTLLALAFVGVMLVYTSVKLSKLTAEVRALAQRQVLAEARREAEATKAPLTTSEAPAATEKAAEKSAESAGKTPVADDGRE